MSPDEMKEKFKLLLTQRQQLQQKGVELQVRFDALVKERDTLAESLRQQGINVDNPQGEIHRIEAELSEKLTQMELTVNKVSLEYANLQQTIKGL